MQQSIHTASIQFNSQIQKHLKIHLNGWYSATYNYCTNFCTIMEKDTLTPVIVHYKAFFQVFTFN